MTKAVVAGLGCISALGNHVDQFWQALLAGQSGIRPISGFDNDNLLNRAGGEVEIGHELTNYAEQNKIGSKLSAFAHWALDQALIDANLSRQSLEGKKTGLVLGSSLGMSLIGDLNNPSVGGNGIFTQCDDFTTMIGEVAANFAISGEVILVTTACASGTHAIGIARDMILYEGYDLVLCGGVDTLDRMKLLGHTALNTLTTTEVSPFTDLRDGTLFGEGAGMLILQRSTVEQLVADDIFCSGSGYSCDTDHVTSPDENGLGAIHVMRQAMQDSGLSPHDIGHLNLHGSGTALNDKMEQIAINAVFGEYAETLPATSIKPAIGHTMGAAGAIESIATILAIRDGKIPPTLNADKPHEAFSSNVLRQQSVNTPIRHAMSTSFGFGGCNGAVVFSRSV